MMKRLLIVGVIVAIVIAGIAMFFSRDPNPTAESQRLSARLVTLQSILDDGSRNLQSGELRAFTSEARILISGDQATIDAAFATVGVKKADKAITAAEADTATFDLLKNAGLSGQYDSTYKSVTTQKLDSTVALMREIKGKTPNAGVRAAMVGSIATIETLQDKLSKL